MNDLQKLNNLVDENPMPEAEDSDVSLNDNKGDSPVAPSTEEVDPE
jgi:hypothetical protein